MMRAELLWSFICQEVRGPSTELCIAVDRETRWNDFGVELAITSKYKIVVHKIRVARKVSKVRKADVWGSLVQNSRAENFCEMVIN